MIRPSVDAPASSSSFLATLDEKAEERGLAASLAHNVNNALTGVIGNLELALRVAPPASSMSDHLTRGLQGAYQIADLIHRIVRFALRTPHAPVRERISLRRVALLAAANGEPAARLQGVQVVLEGESPAWVMGNGRLLQTVLEQLFANALDALPRGGTITFRIEEDAGEGRLRVLDSGPGLSAEAKVRLFEPFFTTKSGGHLGLGLVICKELIEAQHGFIEVNSATDRGATVTLAFALADVPTRESSDRDLGIHRQAPQPGYREPHISLAALDAQCLSNI
ncbi:MAG TPA: HAMP domain-containing sensor histidine kinase [Gemmataceae bacterium]